MSFFQSHILLRATHSLHSPWDHYRHDQTCQDFKGHTFICRETVSWVCRVLYQQQPNTHRLCYVTALQQWNEKKTHKASVPMIHVKKQPETMLSECDRLWNTARSKTWRQTDRSGEKVTETCRSTGEHTQPANLGPAHFDRTFSKGVQTNPRVFIYVYIPVM